MATSTTHTNGTSAHDTDATIDSLYSWWPPQPPASPACPEASFSLCLRGKVQGQDAQLTIRAQTAEQFKANLAAVRGLLDQPQPQAPATPAAPSCPTHGAMKPSTKGQGWYCPHKTADGSWCKGK